MNEPKKYFTWTNNAPSTVFNSDDMRVCLARAYMPSGFQLAMSGLTPDEILSVRASEWVLHAPIDLFLKLELPGVCK